MCYFNLHIPSSLKINFALLNVCSTGRIISSFSSKEVLWTVTLVHSHLAGSLKKYFSKHRFKNVFSMLWKSSSVFYVPEFAYVASRWYMKGHLTSAVVSFLLMALLILWEIHEDLDLNCSRNGLVCEVTALLQPVVQHGFHIEVPEYECTKSDAIVLFCFGLMIWVQPKKTNFSVKIVWRDYKSLPVILQCEGQIKELRKEKMLYQKRATLHFRFSILISIF